MFGHTEDFIW